MSVRTLRYIVLPLGSLMLLLTLFTVALTTFAQEGVQPTATAGPELRTAEPACQIYHVTVPSANVYSCAGASCGVITPLILNTEVCVRGSADNSAYLSVDINTSDPNSPLYYMSRSEIAPGRAGQTNAPTGCFSYLVNVGEAVVYQCAGFDCPVLGSMPFEDWVCGRNYGGQYAGWIYADDSDSGLVGWIQVSDLRPGRSNPNQPPDGSIGPTPGFAQSTGGAVFVPVNPTITPAPGTLTLSPMPLCQQYFVTAVRANIRSCAGEDCPVVERIEQNETVCIRGVMENPDWLYIDLSPEETSSELYAVNKSVVEPGAAPRAANRSYCEIYEVASSVRALARQCPSVTCPALDALEPGTWICVFGYGGEYQEWLQADVPDGARNVWVHGAALRYRADLEGTTPTPFGTEVSYSLSQTPVFFPSPAASTPTATAALFNETPVTEVAVSSVPACVPFRVNVSSAAVRECASTGCANMGVLTRGTEICVLGVNPESSDWFIVDLTPGDPTDQVAYIGQKVVEPVSGETILVAQEASLTPSPTVPTTTPTNTVDPNLSPTPIFTEPPTVTLPPVFTLTPGADTGTPTPTEAPIAVGVPVGPLTAHEIPLAALRVRNIELFSPLSSTQFRFRIPDNWTPEGSNVLYLNFEYFEQIATNTEQVGVESALVSTFEVLMDGDLISTVTLDKNVVGPQVLAIPLPLDKLQNPRLRNHTIQLRLVGDDYCELNSLARVFIRSDQSYFHFEYRENSPVLNLAVYPRPLYNALLPNQTETVVIVLPSKMTQNDLDAAARVASGLGLLTGNSIQLQITTDDAITPEQRQNYNLLLIGLPEENSLIQEYYERGLYPTQRDEDGTLIIEGVPVAEGDGVVQIITNPQNPLRGIITATGQTPEALLRAAQSLGGPPSIMGIGGPVTLISDARAATGVTATVFKNDLTLADLGIDNIVLNGIGTQVAEIEFSIPSGQRLADDAYIEIYYNYSEVLATGGSTLTLLLNDEIPIASRQLLPDAGTGPFTLRGLIPPSGIVPGTINTINIVLNASGNWQCDPPDDSITWFTISRDSVLHLPTQPLDVSTQPTLVGQFPFPFNDQRDLRDVFVSLPEEPTLQDIEQTLKILAALGSATIGGEGFAPTVNLGELPPGIDLSAYHFIVIGRNTTNPFLSSINKNLPQPFAEGTDQLEQVLDDVTFRLPPGYEVGVIETLPSPWQLGRVILVVTGTGPQGQAVAATAMTGAQYGGDDFAGDVVFVSATAIFPVNTAALERRTEVLEEGIPQLETASAQQASASPLPDLNFTATPGPTLTPTLTRTPSMTYTPTSIFTTTPTVASPTPIPTYAPVASDQISGVDVTTPEWVNFLGIATVVVLGVALLYALFTFARRRRT